MVCLSIVFAGVVVDGDLPEPVTAPRLLSWSQIMSHATTCCLPRLNRSASLISLDPSSFRSSDNFRAALSQPLYRFSNVQIKGNR